MDAAAEDRTAFVAVHLNTRKQEGDSGKQTSDLSTLNKVVGLSIGIF